MSNFEDFADHDLPAIDPYKVLGLDRQAEANQVKSAYRKAALKHHPDKVPEGRKSEAHAKFHEIALAYAILSDPGRRRRYDTTGSTAESVVDGDGFNWGEYYRQQFRDAVSADAIQDFADWYKGSETEKHDVLLAYQECEGDMDQVYERVMLSNAAEDDARIRAIIDEGIASESVPLFEAYARESRRKRAARQRAARAEAREAEDYARELGVHDKLFAGRGARPKAGGAGDDLAALIQGRQQDRSAGFLDHLADKYGATGRSGNKGRGGNKGRKRQVVEDDGEPSEEAFQAAAARLSASRTKKAKRQS
ncbi:uncharacterized protein UV8b_01338 [Ustilaginoidea virens]|uniref:J domain-containing protein n=1 Tax=Ustilaginoidea virens TaxID=1159556 RepID=A0A063C2A1_USTVR|nr:uncharacterized protein UV8b_01338 [Ustilaginoidea virens]QUC17097.1 hypothetical protein UV8b_01338 [Ustilaginoidea virens]GAO17692.1 hypothetical protein UVI_02058350 [Ustilaginoidea virens]